LIMVGHRAITISKMKSPASASSIERSKSMLRSPLQMAQRVGS
jgi:hypothetical protein